MITAKVSMSPKAARAAATEITEFLEGRGDTPEAQLSYVVLYLFRKEIQERLQYYDYLHRAQEPPAPEPPTVREERKQ